MYLYSSSRRWVIDICDSLDLEMMAQPDSDINRKIGLSIETAREFEDEI